MKIQSCFNQLQLTPSIKYLRRGGGVGDLRRRGGGAGEGERRLLVGGGEGLLLRLPLKQRIITVESESVAFIIKQSR